jgi:methylated-DNA-protein-cysteine methyltransferase-like protein
VGRTLATLPIGLAFPDNLPQTTANRVAVYRNRLSADSIIAMHSNLTKAFNPQSESSNRQFFREVYKIVPTIPRGKVLTYGQIATMLGVPYLARQVGWAMHGCPKGLPWQRVVGAGGRILINSLSAGGPLQQRKLLELEGVRFIGKRIDMQEHQYVPHMLREQAERRRRPRLRTRQALTLRRQRRASRWEQN